MTQDAPEREQDGAQDTPSGQGSKPESLPATKILVSRFRQIHHLPLIWQGRGRFVPATIREQLVAAGWAPIDDPLNALSEDSKQPDPDVFNEYVYFHDFARKFLYPDGDAAPFQLFRRENPGGISAEFGNDCGWHGFEIVRLTLHLFRTGTIVITVETLHDGKGNLTLAQVQTIIDHFRRSYTPFWSNGQPQRVPRCLRLTSGKSAGEQTQGAMVDFLHENRGTGADAPLLEPWKSWVAPLNQADWRDPSDERVPVMSFIALKQTETTPGDTMLRIRDGDWFRLAEADETGSALFEYNPDFLAPLHNRYFYDRFYPHERTYNYYATRHVFGGAHYSMVTVDNSFAVFMLETHFRRHYEKLALIARFEFASLLAFSSRLTGLVADLERGQEHNEFRANVLKVHEEFLEFTHRCRFTGISSQIQGAEMFARWRASLGLDRLYEDVKAEVTSAADFAHATEANTRALQANRLAGFGLYAAAILAAPGLKDFELVKSATGALTGGLQSLGWASAGPWCELTVPFAVTIVLAEIIRRMLPAAMPQ